MGILDRWFGSRKDLPSLPEVYISGKHWNCFLESVEPEYRQAVYEELKKKDAVKVEGVRNSLIVIGVKKFSYCVDAYNAVLQARKVRKAVYALDRQTIMKLMLARPNLEVGCLMVVKRGELHMERRRLKDFDFDKAFKKGSCAVLVSDDSLSDVLLDLKERDISDAIGHIKIAIGDEDEAKVNRNWKRYGLPCDEITNEERFIEPLARALKDELWQVRLRAVEVLAWMGNARAVDFLIGVLKDEDGHARVRQAALIGLGEIGDVRAVEVLDHIVRKGEDWTIPGRYAFIPAPEQAVQALAKIGSLEVIEPLLWALGDDDSSVRKSAAEALGSMGDSRAIKPLAKALKDKNEDVREAAREALERIKAKKAENGRRPTAYNRA